MPPFYLLVLSALLLISPCYMIALLVFDSNTPPYRRTVRAVGSGILLKAGILGAVGILSLLIENQAMLGLPLLALGAISLAVVRAMQIEMGAKT